MVIIVTGDVNDYGGYYTMMSEQQQTMNTNVQQ